MDILLSNMDNSSIWGDASMMLINVILKQIMSIKLFTTYMTDMGFNLVVS